MVPSLDKDLRCPTNGLHWLRSATAVPHAGIFCKKAVLDAKANKCLKFRCTPNSPAIWISSWRLYTLPYWKGCYRRLRSVSFREASSSRTSRCRRAVWSLEAPAEVSPPVQTMNLPPLISKPDLPQKAPLTGNHIALAIPNL